MKKKREREVSLHVLELARDNDVEVFELTTVDILRNHFPQFTRKLDSSRSTSTHDETQQPFPLFLVDRRESCFLEVVHDSASDRLRILNRLELETVFETWYSVSRVDGSTRDNKLVILRNFHESSRLNFSCEEKKP